MRKVFIFTIFIVINFVIFTRSSIVLGASNITPTPTIPPDPYLNKQQPVYQWTRTVGEVDNGTGSETVQDIAFDSKNNIYITGYFANTTDFDPSPAQDRKTSAGSNDMFLTKYDNNGNYLWTKTIGGIGFDYGAEIRIDSKDNIYVGGIATAKRSVGFLI